MSSQSGGRQTVMVVDDSDDVREMVMMLLRLSGYDVIEARDGFEALELAAQQCPALIVMDLQMPGMDGLTATRLIRQIEGLCGTAIIAYSAYGGDYPKQAIDAGCNEYVSKDKGVSQLTGVVHQYLTAA